MHSSCIVKLNGQICYLHSTIELEAMPLFVIGYDGIWRNCNLDYKNSNFFVGLLELNKFNHCSENIYECKKNSKVKLNI